GTAVGTVQASDAETNNLMFAITAGNTGDVFDINQNTGDITTAGSLDFENNPNYTLTVSVSDGELSATADITINVTNVNDNVPTIVDQTFSVAEDAANNTAVGTVQAADADMDNLTFSITSGNTGNVFDINTRSGAITTAGTLDFENTSTYTLAVKVSDGKLSGTANITINVKEGADFAVSSTNTTINVPGYANVYTVNVETVLTNWSVSSSNQAIIPDAEIQKLSNTQFLMPIGGYPVVAEGNSRSIMLTVSGAGGSDLVLTVNQTKNMVTSNIISALKQEFDPVIIFMSPYEEKSTIYSRDLSFLISQFEVNNTAHPYTVSVSPSENIRLRNLGPGAFTFNLLPPSGSTNTYAIISVTSDSDPTIKENLVIILRPPSDR
ncbi:MAG: cadherin repeat domain-containing protein, partial [Ekhidna sp.]|nr:cadherin repeat domain-containing protein [Ekhidna sp.]